MGGKRLAGSADSRAVAMTLLVLGGVSLYEAWRLMSLRKGIIAGDDTFPWILGVFFIGLGAYLLCAFQPAPARVVLPTGRARTRMIASGAALLAYVAAAPYLGYGTSTLLGSALLFRCMGQYRWPFCLIGGALLAGAIHVVFRVWLLIALPSGWLGF